MTEDRLVDGNVNQKSGIRFGDGTGDGGGCDYKGQQEGCLCGWNYSVF